MVDKQIASCDVKRFCTVSGLFEVVSLVMSGPSLGIGVCLRLLFVLDSLICSNKLSE